MKRIAYILCALLAFTALAMPPQDDNTRPKRPAPKAQPKNVTVEDETIPDSLVHSRWRIQRTAPVLTEDMDSSALDLKMPENVKLEPVYNDSLNVYFFGSKLGDSYLNAPFVMSPEEYLKWSEQRARQQFFRKKDAENAAAKGNTAGAAAAQQSSSRFGSIMRNVGLLAGGMFLGSMLANLFGMGGFMGDVLGLLANIFLFGAVFMLLRWAWNKFRGNSNSSYSGNSWQRPSEPVDVTPRENQRPVYQDISRIPSGDYDAKTTADRYRNR